MPDKALEEYTKIQKPAYNQLVQEIDGVNWVCYEVLLSARQGDTYGWRRGYSVHHQEKLDSDDFAVSQIATAFSNEQRVRIMRTLYEGHHTFAEIKEQTGLNAGQLQHHLKELALSSFLQATSKRNHYELSRRGKALLLLMVVIGKWQPDVDNEAFLTPENVEQIDAS